MQRSGLLSQFLGDRFERMALRVKQRSGKSAQGSEQPVIVVEAASLPVRPSIVCKVIVRGQSLTIFLMQLVNISRPMACQDGDLERPSGKTRKERPRYSSQVRAESTEYSLVLSVMDSSQGSIAHMPWL